MKKTILIILSALMIVGLAVPSFADTTEEEAEILDAAKKGVIIASFIWGEHQLIYDAYKIAKFENKFDENFDFMNGLIKYNDSKINIDSFHIIVYNPYEGEMYIPTDIEDPRIFDNQETRYIQTGDRVNTFEDVKNLLDRYLTDTCIVITDENNVPLIDGKYKDHHPMFRIIDGELCLYLGWGILSESPCKMFFDEFEVLSINGNKALVKAPQYDSYYGEKFDFTIELKKENGLWKVCGGTTFTAEEGAFAQGDSPFVPQTGEDFSLVTHTVIIGVTLSLMLILIKKRKKVA